MDAVTVDQKISEMELDGISHQTERVYKSQQEFFKSGATRSKAFRLKQLQVLEQAIVSNESLLMEALYKDLRRSEYESFGTEIGPVLAEIKFARTHLNEWMSKKRVATPLMFLPSRSYIQPDPLGVVLTIGPWNYPFMLIMCSLVSAIAGGNTVILKPSDEAVHVSDVIEKIITENFEEKYLAVVQVPGPMVTRQLTDRFHFDHIFFTGSVRVGKLIMESAAKHLSPVTLELGGKSPCIVEADADLDFAAKKISWSKSINAGQVCVAPDYLLVHEKVKDALVEKIRNQWQNMFGTDVQKSPDYPRLINHKRFEAVSRLMKKGRIIYGGQQDEADLFIAPTLMDELNPDDPVMQEEIFGPLLPVFSFKNREEVVDFISSKPYPLALYLYTRSRTAEEFYTEHIRFGGGCINNGIIHLGNPNLPFGGVGSSGMGQYHGYAGFQTFTRPKSIMKSPTWFDVPLWYPPYKGKLKWVRRAFRL